MLNLMETAAAVVYATVQHPSAVLGNPEFSDRQIAGCICRHYGWRRSEARALVRNHMLPIRRFRAETARLARIVSRITYKGGK